MNGLLAAWIAEATIITWRSFTQDHRPPLPSEFLASFVIYGALGLIAENETARPAATALGWGLVIATALRLGPADFNAAGAGLAGTASSIPASVSAIPAPRPTSTASQPPLRVGRPN